MGAGWGLRAHSCGQGSRCLSPALAPRMGSSSLSEDYRQCLERELRRGRAGVCGDPSLRAVLWQILVEDFDLHGALQDDALALLTDGLWGRADLAPALRGLARAFELLELAAVHLYLLPWRKEFTTIKVGAGAEDGAFWTRRGGEGSRGSSAPGLGAQSALRRPACVGSALGRGPWALPALRTRGGWRPPQGAGLRVAPAPESFRHCPPQSGLAAPGATEILRQAHGKDASFHGRPHSSRMWAGPLDREGSRGVCPGKAGGGWGWGSDWACG